MMMPDVNLLVAGADPSHSLHGVAMAWFQANLRVATCAITELGMVRVLIQLRVPINEAEKHLAFLIENHRGIFVNCDLSADALKGKILGPKQITDKYLVELCSRHGLTLATLDKSIPGSHLVT